MQPTPDELRPLPLFRGMNESELTTIGRCVRRVAAQPGKVLFDQGHPPTGAFVVASGEVDIELVLPTGKVRPLTRLHACRVFGESSLLDGAPRDVRARVWMQAELLLLDQAAFDALRKARDPAAYKVVRNITRVLCLRLRTTNRQLQQGWYMADEETEEIMRARRTAPAAEPTSIWDRLRNMLVGGDS